MVIACRGGGMPRYYNASPGDGAGREKGIVKREERREQGRRRFSQENRRLPWCGQQDSNLHACAVEPKSTESTNSTMPANEGVENVKLKIESYCFADRTMLVSILGIANTLFQPFLSMRRALRPNFPLSIFNFQLKRFHSIIYKNFCQPPSPLFVKYDEKVLDNVPRCK